MQLDTLRLLLWSKTKDCAKGRNAPDLLWKRMVGRKENEEAMDFDTLEDFESYWKRNGGG